MVTIPRLRRRPKETPAPPAPEQAIVVKRLVAHGFAPLERCQLVSIDDPRVITFPHHLLGVVPLTSDEAET